MRNGIRMLERLTTHTRGATLSALADELELNRTSAHRLVKTLEAHGLVIRDEHKLWHPGWQLIALAEAVQTDVRSVARPIMESLSDRTMATSYLVSEINNEEVMALDVIEPRNAKMHIAFKAGQRHPRDRGSAGIALLAGGKYIPGERPEVTKARQRGYAISSAEVIPSTVGIAAPVCSIKLASAASLGISVFDDSCAEELGHEVQTAAHELSRTLNKTL